MGDISTLAHEVLANAAGMLAAESLALVADLLILLAVADAVVGVEYRSVAAEVDDDGVADAGSFAAASADAEMRAAEESVAEDLGTKLSAAGP